MRLRLIPIILRRHQNSKIRIIATIFIVCSPPYIAECIRIRSIKWQLVGDPAMEVLRALDLGHYTPLIGVYSRFEWNHPGPAIYFLLAIPIHIGNYIAMSVAYWAIFLNLILIALAIAIILQSVGRLAALILGLCLILANINGVDDVSSVWNPAIALPFFALLLIITMFAWSNRYALLWISLLGSIVIQLHVGYVIPVFSVLLALLIARVNQRKNSGLFFNARELFSTLVINFTVWLLPIWDQFFGSGNFGKIIHHFFSDQQDIVGFGQSSRMMAYHLLPRAPWNGGREIISFSQNSQVSALWLLLPAIIFIFLTWASISHVRQLRIAVLTIAMTIFAALISIARLTGIATPYMYGWVRIIAAVFWGLFLFAGFRVFLYYFQIYRKVLHKVLVVLAVTALSLSIFMAYYRSTPLKGAMKAVTYLTPFALAIVPPGAQVGFMTADPLIGVGDGIILQYELNNRHVRMNGSAMIQPSAVAARFGSQRVGLGSATIEVVTVPGDSVKSFAAEGFTSLASYDLKRGHANNLENIDESGDVIYLMSRKVPAVNIDQ